jgi:hypothetical protein
MEEVKVAAYIMVVMQGCPFFMGAREGLRLLKDHAELVGTVHMVTKVRVYFNVRSFTAPPSLR